MGRVEARSRLLWRLRSFVRILLAGICRIPRGSSRRYARDTRVLSEGVAPRPSLVPRSFSPPFFQRFSPFSPADPPAARLARASLLRTRIIAK